MVAYGIDLVDEYAGKFRGRRLGLIASSSSRDGALRPDIDLLHQKFGLRALFGPEHGVRGSAGAGQAVGHSTDEATGLPVYSLYRADSRRMTDEMLDEVDAVVYDIQDVGARYYTYLSTLLYTMEDCARCGKELIVLDRPDPLGGDVTEGNLLSEKWFSFVGAYPLCIRYGLTPGELALMMQKERKLDCALTVVPCRGWKREELFPQTGNLWMMPSPNIPRFETALLYPGTCLFEGTTLSEGRGTACPFEIIGAPWVDGERLAAEMNAKHLPGVVFTSVYFTPSASKHKGEPCGGVQLHVSDPRAVRAVRTGLELLCAVRRLWPERFGLLPPGADGVPFLRRLSGCPELEEPDASPDALLAGFEADRRAWDERRREYYLY